MVLHWEIAKPLFDATWVAWWFYLTVAALGYATGAINTRTDNGAQILTVIFAALYLSTWAALRVYVL